MKIDMTQILTEAGKKEIKDAEGALTLKRVLLLAFMTNEMDYRGTTPDEAVKHRKLFNKIDSSDKEVELKAEEISKIKEVVSARLNRFTAGTICLMLDPESEGEK